jgi:hypothetical protein
MSSSTRSGAFRDGALEARFALGGGEDAVALVFQAILQRGAHGQFVFDDQNSGIIGRFHF